MILRQINLKDSVEQKIVFSSKILKTLIITTAIMVIVMTITIAESNDILRQQTNMVLSLTKII